MKTIMKLFTVIALLLSLVACNSTPDDSQPEKKVYRIGICNYVDDASLNQIADNIQNQLKKLFDAQQIEFEIYYENPNADANVMSQIITSFISRNVDLMVGIATPVAMAMQTATEDNRIPVIFSAVSDPLSVNLVDSLAVPGGNISGTSDYLDTASVMNLILALNPDISKVGLLYDLGQDASTTAIAAAKDFLNSKGITIVEKTGTNVEEIRLAAQSLINEGVQAIFTPQDNTVMTAELSIYEAIAEAGIPHYTGADSFALNGAFLGYGVDYANLGVETANMVFDVLVNGKDIAKLPVMTFDNGTATVNVETCAHIGYSYDDVAALFGPYCIKVQPIHTADEFE